MAGGNGNGAAEQWGRPCPTAGCDGKIGVTTTRINFAMQVRIRYFGCRKCGYPTGKKQTVPLEFAPSRAKK